MRTHFARFFFASLLPTIAWAQPAATADRAPATDAKALVAAPKDIKDAPAENKSSDNTNASVSAGGMLSTGNTQTQALTLNSTLDLRRGMNGFGAALLGNYGRSKLAGADSQTTAENFQARVRYDRYLTERFALFLQLTERYDRFQGLASRTNVDPGVKYIFFLREKSAFWGELGYDYMHDIRTPSGRRSLDADGNKDYSVPLLDKTLDDHSARAYLGFRHAFNGEVTFSTGLEYLQSFVKTELATGNSRVNFDATLAAKLYGGIAAGVGFTARYDRNPLEGRSKLDTATTLSLIYAFSDVKADDAPTCPACPAIPPCPNAAPADPTTPSGTSPAGIAPPGTTPPDQPVPATTTPPASGTTPPPPAGADTQLR
jgi:putative salt-induced outer membrane protein YdiY